MPARISVMYSDERRWGYLTFSSCWMIGKMLRALFDCRLKLSISGWQGAQILVDHRTAQVGIPVLRRPPAAADRAVDAQQRLLHQVVRRCAIVGQLITHPQQPIAGIRDQLRQHIIEFHATTSGLSR